MSFYDGYKHLLGKPYVDGTDDCYGTVRAYYRDLYSLHLSNYARSADFFFAGINLLEQHMSDEGFVAADTSLRNLQLGDGLLMSVASRQGIVNHCAVYVGNGHILHHLWAKKSVEDSLDAMWRARVVNVVRHPEVTEKNRNRPRDPVQLIDLLPHHAKQKFGL